MDNLLTRIDQSVLYANGMHPAEVQQFLHQLGTFCQSEQSQTDPELCWQAVTQQLLTAAVPFAIHRHLYDIIFCNHCASTPPALYIPSQEAIDYSNAGQLISSLSLRDYDDLVAYCCRHKSDFLQAGLERLHIQFQTPATSILDSSQGPEHPQWLAGARMNIVESCLAHNADGDSKAIISHDSDGTLHGTSYAALADSCAQIVSSLRAGGIQAGQRIALAMPMHEQSVAACLAIIACGCSAVMIAESFSTEEIKIRLDIAAPELIVTQDYIQRGSKQLPLYEKIAAASETACIVLETTSDASKRIAIRTQDQHWHAFLSEQTDYTYHYAAADTEIMVIFSSGTTDKPKAIPWTQSMPIKSALDAHFHHDLHPGDVVAWPTSLGWMMGPWLVFASLLNNSCIALSSHVPSSRAFGRFIQDAQVSMLGLVPSLVSAWRQSDCMYGLDWSKIRAFSSTGECSNAEDMHFLMSLANYKPIIEYCGGTETAGGYITGTVCKPCIPGTFSSAALGFSWILLDQENQLTDNGDVYFQCPVFGLSNRLLNADHHAIYYADTPQLADQSCLRRHGDQIESLGNGYYRAHGRSDDAMNLGGIKVGAAEIEEYLQQVPGIKELAAIAVAPAQGGPSRLIIALVPMQKPTDSKTFKAQTMHSMQQIIRQQLNPLFKIHDLMLLDALPRTASNKVMRRVLRTQYAQQESH